jgi:hypothetical protein
LTLPASEIAAGVSFNAQRATPVAEAYGDKWDRLSHLKLEALYELAAPEEVRAEVERRIAAGELVSGEKAHNAEAAALGRHGNGFVEAELLKQVLEIFLDGRSIRPRRTRLAALNLRQRPTQLPPRHHPQIVDRTSLTR